MLAQLKMGEHMEDNHLGVSSQVEYFRSGDDSYYDSQRFRQVEIRTLFEGRVRSRIGWIVGIPPGLQQDDPDIDNLTDATFAQIERTLNPVMIARAATPADRRGICLAIVLNVATKNAREFVKENGKPSNHGDFSIDIYGHEPQAPEPLLSEEAKLAEPQEAREITSRRVFELLHEVLPKVKEEDIEIFWLRKIEGLQIRELSQRFKLREGTIRIRIFRVMEKAREIFSDPVMRRRLQGGENDKEQ